MERTGIYCVLLSLLVMVTMHTCNGQKPDLIIRYGKSYPARPRVMPKSSFYAKRNEMLLRDNNDFLKDFPQDADADVKEAVIDDGEYIETPYEMDPFSFWKSQRQRFARPKFLRN